MVGPIKPVSPVYPILDRRQMLTGAWRGKSLATPKLTFRAEHCWRASGQDMGCDYCYKACPLKNVAISMTFGSPPAFNHAACTGCGDCVEICPAAPKPLSIGP